jgi:hypothetical protein
VPDNGLLQLVNRNYQPPVIIVLPRQVIPSGKSVVEIDFKKYGIKFQERALGSLSALTHPDCGIVLYEMLNKALTYRFKGHMLNATMNIISRIGKKI